jgi:type IV secretion system protein VirD4
MTSTEAPAPAVWTQPDMPITLKEQVFLGFNPAAPGQWKRAWSDRRDAVGVVGPPGYGKTAGVVIPAVLHWAGPVVSSSTRGDILRATGDWRRQVAAPYGGGVAVYDPFGSEPGLTSVGWSPLDGCQDPSLCYRRASAMTGSAGQGITDGPHWQRGAARILRAYFHAAALTGRGVRDVRQWLARQDTRAAADILREANTPAAYWADDLEAMSLKGERERGSYFSVAENCLEATADPRVLASCEGPGLDIDRFLATRSTLYIVGPSHYQQALAPMIVGLVDAIWQRAAELAAIAGGRLDPALLLALDEVSNTAPIHLGPLVSEGGGRGIVTVWTTQNLAQLRERYGVEAASSILSASSVKLIYGGLSSGIDLQNISAWAGERRESVATFYNGPPVAQARQAVPSTMGGLGTAGEAGGQQAITSQYRPVLPVQAIQMLPKLRVWCWYGPEAPTVHHTPPAGLVPAYQRVAGYHPDSAGAG